MSEPKTSILFQVPTDEYYKLLKLKGTKQSWYNFFIPDKLTKQSH